MLKHCFPLILALSLVANGEPVDERVSTIRGWYSEIQAAEADGGHLIKFESGKDAFMGTAQVREFNGALASVHVSYSDGDHGGADEYYYFKHGELFFVFEVISSWKFDPDKGTPDQPATLDTRVENRFYYDHRRCVRQLTRSATASDAAKLVKLTATTDNQIVKPGDHAAELQKRGDRLLKASSAADILAIYGISD